MNSDNFGWQKWQMPHKISNGFAFGRILKRELGYILLKFSCIMVWLQKILTTGIHLQLIEFQLKILKTTRITKNHAIRCSNSTFKLKKNLLLLFPQWDAQEFLKFTKCFYHRNLTHSNLKMISMNEWPINRFFEYTLKLIILY